MPGSVGSIAHGCWSLPPMADGQACVLPPGANGECSFTLIGRPVFMSTFSAQFVVTYLLARRDRKSTRLNSSHSQISYAVFCLKKKINRLWTLNPGLQRTRSVVRELDRSFV